MCGIATSWKFTAWTHPYKHNYHNQLVATSPHNWGTKIQSMTVEALLTAIPGSIAQTCYNELRRYVLTVTCPMWCDGSAVDIVHSQKLPRPTWAGLAICCMCIPMHYWLIYIASGGYSACVMEGGSFLNAEVCTNDTCLFRSDCHAHSQEWHMVNMRV